MIRLEHVEKKFENGGTILKDVNAVIKDGDVISVIGPSGTGKSTLLRCINMLSAPTAGKIFIDDEEVTAEGYPLINVHKKIGMVFQSYSLFNHLSVIENVMLPQIEVYKRGKQEAYDRGMDILATVGMAQKANSFPSSLSGGQKQRVAIARTLATDPDIILFDEPTSALDPSMVDEVKSVIRDVAETGKTVMIVTHDMGFAKSICNRVFFMDQGGIYDDGTPEEIFDHPKKPNTIRFIERIKSMEVDIDDRDFDFVGIMSDISAFGTRNQFDPKLINKIQIVVEELIYTQLLPVLPDRIKIKLKIAFSEEKSNTAMMLEYNGSQMNVLEDSTEASDDINDIMKKASKMLIMNSIENFNYKYEPDSESGNQLILSFK